MDMILFIQMENMHILFILLECYQTIKIKVMELNY